jgi:glycosyltransferase involved in cell wall biosynthesis
MALLFNAAEFLAFPSTTDTFGRVVLEAMACGTPAVVSSVGGPRELVQPGVTGTIVPTQSVGDWSDAIADMKRKVASDSEKGIAAATRGFVVSRYGLHQFFGDIIAGGERAEGKEHRKATA